MLAQQNKKIEQKVYGETRPLSGVRTPTTQVL